MMKLISLHYINVFVTGKKEVVMYYRQFVMSNCLSKDSKFLIG